MATITAPAVPRVVIDMETFERVTLRPSPDFNDDDFFDFCQRPENELYRIERDADGDIIIMSPVGFEGTVFEYKVGLQLGIWADKDGRGLVLSPNAGLKLPDGSTLSPDCCWVPHELWKAIPRNKRKKFPSLVPPFVIEVRSASDRRKDLYEKMLVYLRNGVGLGWLIDPLRRTVRIYRQGAEFVELNDPLQVEGEGPVAGFVLNLKRIYDQLDL